VNASHLVKAKPLVADDELLVADELESEVLSEVWKLRMIGTTCRGTCKAAICSARTSVSTCKGVEVLFVTLSGVCEHLFQSWQHGIEHFKAKV
jgi:hypothetical protein